MPHRSTLPMRILPYIHLARLHRPIGISLLLWPSLWALWLASDGTPTLKLILIFCAGAVIMRSAGCVINDLADQRFDGSVARTTQRPLVTGTLSRTQAKGFALFLLALALIPAAFLDSRTQAMIPVALLLTILYPFTKRFFLVPQLVLGMAFGWAVPMAWMAATGHLPLDAWLLYTVAILWAVAYDTQYAMADRADDLKIGLHSSAILFGQADRAIVLTIQILMLALLAWIGLRRELPALNFIALALALPFFGWQYYHTRQRDPQACLKAFTNNHRVGLWLFVACVLGTWS